MPEISLILYKQIKDSVEEYVLLYAAAGYYTDIKNTVKLGSAMEDIDDELFQAIHKLRTQ